MNKNKRTQSKELLEKQGQYYRLWEMQQGNFKVEEERQRKQCRMPQQLI